MNTKLYLLTFLFTLTALPAFSQSWESVKGSNIYLWGEGWGASVAEADKQALNDLISKISLQVSGSVTHNETETVTNEGIESSSTFSSVVNTYSSATLINTEKVIIENEPDAHVGRWIRRSDIAKIFESRKHKISDYISSALKAESQGKIDITLKDLYWALALTKTLQDPNDFRYVDDEGESLLAVTWIPRHINEILDNLSVEVVKRTGDDIEMQIRYLGKPINSIDYTFFDGRDWSNIYSAKDGLGVLELAPGNANSYYQVKFEYEYRGEAHIDREVESVLNSIGSIPMRNAYKSIKADAPSISVRVNQDSSPVANSFASVPAEIYSMPEVIADTNMYQKVLTSLASTIVNKQYDGLDEIFTPDAKEIYEQLIKYGKAKIVGTPNYSFYQYGDNVIARGLQMSFSFKSGMRKSFVEEVVISFNKDAKINNISFGLGKTAEADILGKGIWDENARLAIMGFLENYQTAYALKRLDYISSIFDDDAVIITGTVTHAPAKKVSNGDIQGMAFGNDIIKYNRHTKDSYLRQLKNSFASKEYINLRFASNDVRKLGKGGELYAIQISQEYYSSNYGDKGYLFLMVDINDPEKPIIKVRTWQPEKDPNFGIYGPEHFK
ncbi:MAG: LPP20 family lipoprotein [Muribaculaceae bacterium]|nr:LPP20 family lipoprotein [Muribaculaceae bacterium]